MGVILCSRTDPAHALRIDDLGIRVYSAEELCYLMRRYPELFLDRFAGDAFYDFLAFGAGEQDLAAELRLLQDNGAPEEDILGRFLEASGCVTEEEIDAFRAAAARWKKLSQAGRMTRRADTLFRLKKFGRALKLYESVLSGAGGGPEDEPDRGRILERAGNSYANLFLSEKAFRSYERAYAILKDKRILRKIYFLACMEPVLGNKQRYLEAVGSEADPKWDEEYADAVRRAETGPGREKIAEIFAGDPVQRARDAAAAVRKWKDIYRQM